MYKKTYLDHVYCVSDSDGDLIEHYRYSAFGEIEVYSPTGTKLADSAIGNTVTWNSRRYDFDTELYYYKYRHYAVSIGRWLGRDPIEDMAQNTINIGINETQNILMTPYYFYLKEEFRKLYKSDNEGFRLMMQEVVENLLSSIDAPQPLTESRQYADYSKWSYVYVQNEPLNAVDIYGLDRWADGIGHSGLIIPDPKSPTGYTKWNFGPANPLKFCHGAGMIWKEHVKKPTAKPDVVTTAKEDATATAYLEAAIKNPPNYCIFGANCKHMVGAWKVIGTNNELSPANFIPLISNPTNSGNANPPPRTENDRFGCFVKGTKVDTDDGTIAIDTLKVGQKVWSFDFENSEWILKPITETHIYEYIGILYTLKIGNELVKVTEEHPFWVVEGVDLLTRPQSMCKKVRSEKQQSWGRWVPAHALKEGDQLYSKDGQKILIQGISSESVEQSVYNITVNQTHNYLVGGFKLLVHNK